MRTKHRLTARRNRVGYIFVAPFCFGFVFFLLIPIVQSFIFSLNEIKLGQAGYTLTYVGWSNYIRAFQIDPDFRMDLVESIGQMLLDLPVILFFSLFSAILLNKKFRGRTAARMLFFLPVIVSTGIMVVMESNNPVYSMMMSRSVADSASGLRESADSMEFVLALLGGGLPAPLLNYLVAVIGRLYDLVIASGVQILIFLSGLNTISPALYESSNIEGATAWENFWKITMPMVGPYFLLNTVYTIIDSFTNMKNVVVSTIRGYIVSFSDFSYGAAISWIYFGIIFLILGLLTALLSKKVFYYE